MSPSPEPLPAVGADLSTAELNRLMVRLRDPLRFAKLCWPDVTFYRGQREVIRSVEQNDRTFVPAGNELGKDFVSGFIAVWWFCTRMPARVVTTSVKVDQLEDVLWGEIRRFIKESKVKLPIVYNHLKIRRLLDDGSLHPNSELVGQVSNTAEGLLGRHSTAGFKPIPNDVPRTLVIFDEASGIDDATFRSVQTWAHRILGVGNTWACDQFFKREVNGGDILRDDRDLSKGYHRKVIRLTAEDSPNVRWARAEMASGVEPTDKVVVPGVKRWSKYQENRKLWDAELQCIGLDAQWWEGLESKMYPKAWLDASAVRAAALAGSGTPRRARAIGIDPAEGGDKTAMCVVDERGVLEMRSMLTPDTSVIRREVVALMGRWGVPDSKVMFDRGGGGKQVADEMRAAGMRGVRTVAFGEAITLEPKRAKRLFPEKVEYKEERYECKNRRAQMALNLRVMLDPSSGVGFAIPAELTTLRSEMAPIPRLQDGEGRLYMLQKRKNGPDDKKPTLIDLIGHSPDEFDALLVAVEAMTSRPVQTAAGVPK